MQTSWRRRHDSLQSDDTHEYVTDDLETTFDAKYPGIEEEDWELQYRHLYNV